jgi:hypothetical protein
MNRIPSDKSHDQPRVPIPDQAERPIGVEPDDEEERRGYGWSWSQRVSRKLHDEQSRQRLDSGNESSSGDLNGHHKAGNGHDTAMDENDVSIIDRSAMGAEAGHMSDVLRWALDSLHEPAMAAADWLARDIDPVQPTATALLTNPKVTLLQVKQAKSVFKTMRIVGEKSADRRVGARMYAGAIAAGLVRHQKLISRQTTEALRRGFEKLLDDHRMPQPLRDLAGMAICALNDKKYQLDAKDEFPHSPAPQAKRAASSSSSNGKRPKR